MLFEALLVALINGRRNVIEYMASRAAPIYSTLYGRTLIDIAEGNGMMDMAERLPELGGGAGADRDPDRV